MQKKRVVLVLIAIFLVLAGIGGTKKVVEMRQEAQKERQIKFLKRNKDIIINKAFTVDGKLDVKDIDFYWDTVQVEYSGIIKSKPYGLSIKVTSTRLSDSKKYADILIIKTDVERLDSVVDVAFK